MAKSDDFSFEIKENLGTLSENSTGWKKELNLVEWNGNNAKLDIRDWDPKHEHMSRGITLRNEEARILADLIYEYLNRTERSGAE